MMNLSTQHDTMIRLARVRVQMYCGYKVDILRMKYLQRDVDLDWGRGKVIWKSCCKLTLS